MPDIGHFPIVDQRISFSLAAPQVSRAQDAPATAAVPPPPQASSSTPRARLAEARAANQAAEVQVAVRDLAAALQFHATKASCCFLGVGSNRGFVEFGFSFDAESTLEPESVALGTPCALPPCHRRRARGCCADHV